MVTIEPAWMAPACSIHRRLSSSARWGAVGSGIVSAVGAEISKSRFAAPPATNRFRARVSLGALTSTAALVALIAGLGYGGYALLQDIQRVGIAPLPEAPNVVADAPQIEVPDIDLQALQKPQAGDYRGGGALASIVAPTQLSQLEELRRDGPISAINPETAGMFARLRENAPQTIDTPDDGVMLAEAHSSLETELPTSGAQEAPIKGVSLVFKEEAWIRVRESNNTTLFEGIYAAGERIQLPARLEAPRLRAGNAGGIFVYIDGVPYGPVGRRGLVASNVSLLAEDVRNSMPQATDGFPDTADQETPSIQVQRRAEVQVGQ